MGQLLILKKFLTPLELLQESINLKYKYFSQKLKNYGENHNPQDALMLIGCRYDLERTHRMDKSLKKFSNRLIQSFYAFTFMVSVFNAYILASVLTVDYYTVKMAHIPVYTTLISLTYILIVYYLSTKFVGYNKILANN